jgi:hypothetical protein
MITNVGKNILAKYLIGQAPAYASHIALGCGATPKAIDYAFTGNDIQDILDKKQLDFEMFRVPITSRGYVNENGISKIVLTAELPTIERYEITEIGVYSSGSNPTAGAYDSKPIYSFTRTENWEYHTDTAAVTIPTITQPLGTEADPDDIIQTSPVFQTNADNRTLLNESRITRYESCRYLNNIILMAGGESTLSLSGSRMVPAVGSNHIHLTGASIDFNRNSASDELRFAFSVVNKNAYDSVEPSRVKVLVEFASSDSDSATNYAQLQVDIQNGTGSGQQDFENNRYVVVTKPLKDLVKSSTFTWNSVTVVKIWASVLDSVGNPTDDYYVALDALRLENTTSVNPLYGLTGYSVVKSQDALPIVKIPNTANLVEFRFALDVDLGIDVVS